MAGLPDPLFRRIFALFCGSAPLIGLFCCWSLRFDNDFVGGGKPKFVQLLVAVNLEDGSFPEDCGCYFAWWMLQNHDVLQCGFSQSFCVGHFRLLEAGIVFDCLVLGIQPLALSVSRTSLVRIFSVVCFTFLN